MSGSRFVTTYGFKTLQYFQIKEQNHQKICNPLGFYLPSRDIFARSYTSPHLAQSLVRHRLWVPLLYMATFDNKMMRGNHRIR